VVVEEPEDDSDDPDDPDAAPPLEAEP